MIHVTMLASTVWMIYNYSKLFKKPIVNYSLAKKNIKLFKWLEKKTCLFSTIGVLVCQKKYNKIKIDYKEFKHI